MPPPEDPVVAADVEAYYSRLLRDPALRASMGRAGRLRMQKHFTIERLTDEFLEEYASPGGSNPAGAVSTKLDGPAGR